MKKLLSSILALILTLCLAVPALALGPAADTDPPIWQDWGYSSYEEMLSDGWTEDEYAELVCEAKESAARAAVYRASHAGELALFDADAYFTEEFSYYWEKAEYMAAFHLADQAAFQADMLESYILTQLFIEDCKDNWATLQAGEPERTALFLAELDSWLRQEYGVKGIDAYLKVYDYYDCPEEVYLELFEEWNWEYVYQRERQREIADFITAHGGVPGSLGVMLNGQYLSFPQGRAPYSKGGAVYADAAILSKALGIELPAPIDGYVAVRSAAQNAGLTVYWDGEYQTAVLLDTAALAAQLDKEFTVVNGLLAKWTAAQGGTARETADLKGNITLFDSLDGDKIGSASLNMDLIRSPKGFQGTAKYDLSKLSTLIEALPSLSMSDLSLVKALQADALELRADYESGKLYLQGALLDFFSAHSSGRWHAFDFPTPLPAATATLGAVLVSMQAQPMYGENPVRFYDDAMTSAAQTALFLGDSAFVKQGEDYVLTLTREDYAALMGIEEDWSYALPKKLDLTLTIKPTGCVTGTLVYQYDSYGAAFRILADFDLSPARQVLTLDVHIKNQLQIKLELTGSSVPTTQVPATVPPAGADIVEY